MLALLTYSTPNKFDFAFKEFYANINVKNIKFLSLALLAISLITRAISLVYLEQSLAIKAYNELSLLNYIEIIGFSIFLLLSTLALNANWTLQNKKSLTFSFVIFILLVSLATSYIASSYNTKNTLTMFLMGIFAVSLFFILEYKQIISTAVFIAIVFMLSMVLPKISFEDKLLNTIIGMVLGFFLVSLSRYNYYYQSQNFVKIKELEDKNLKIQQLNIEKKDILNFVAHDLRNPLNNIEALSNLMVLNQTNTEEAKMIASSAKQAKEIINDLLIGVKPNPDYPETTRIELSESLIGIIEKWTVNTKRKIQFINHSSESYTYINPSKLERVIDNLINNSIKFSESNQPIHINLAKTSNEICIKIQDFGIGIPKELQENIFEQFSKAGRTGLKGEKSTGLGLHISKKIIEEHQGRLLMSSEENNGTTFDIILPLA